MIMKHRKLIFASLDALQPAQPMMKLVKRIQEKLAQLSDTKVHSGCCTA